ncbi:AAA family ATPase [Shinella sp. CPCC 101442]|uniref:AAA family ATPase n=1 Tax=Shinella sp. CPCC 101442 TaxID=2932265 RepID=UPI00215296E5|nr:AAA family ATPase [Shinella sp. CPCC 101442]MCR6500926.1 AAA family ATPase [Shinella sp. CPCC 101442]
MSDRFIVLSGCSGGGKSTLLEELRRRGHATVAEPGRRIVQEELASGGTALPWLDLAAFARRAIALALADLDAMREQAGFVFFDRGLIDAASALEAHCGEPVLAALATQHRYNTKVFLTPPWPEIYAGDAERRHGFEAALAEYARLETTYPTLGYETVILPKVAVAERADFVLARL